MAEASCAHIEAVTSVKRQNAVSAMSA